MTWRYWLKRFVRALVPAGAALFIVQWLKGRAASDAAVFAGFFTGIDEVRYRRNPACRLPRSRRD
jgi:hypothetical protein